MLDRFKCAEMLVHGPRSCLSSRHMEHWRSVLGPSLAADRIWPNANAHACPLPRLLTPIA